MKPIKICPKIINGDKIELSKEEFEKMLKMVYADGYSDGYSKGIISSIPSSPSIPFIPYDEQYKITCNNNNKDIASKIGMEGLKWQV